MKNNIEKKDWQEFRGTGLFLFINSILHAFGWVIVCQTDDEGNITGAFPARTKYRGFDNADQDEAHTKIADYLAKNAPNFPGEIKL